MRVILYYAELSCIVKIDATKGWSTPLHMLCVLPHFRPSSRNCYVYIVMKLNVSSNAFKISCLVPPLWFITCREKYTSSKSSSDKQCYQSVEINQQKYLFISKQKHKDMEHRMSLVTTVMIRITHYKVK